MVLNRQRACHLGRGFSGCLRRRLQAALPLVLASCREGGSLPELPEVTVVLLSSRRMARLHSQFLGDPAPTDVITFHHGEIALGIEVAFREAAARGLDLFEEVSLYAIHGLLHLAGWNDHALRDARSMALRQSEILRSTRPALC